MAAPAELDINITQGDDYVAEYVYESPPGTPVDITGATFRQQVRHNFADDAPIVLIDVSTTPGPDGEISILDASAGRFEVHFNADATERLNLSGERTFRQDLEMVLAGRKVTLFTGVANLTLEVTRE